MTFYEIGVLIPVAEPTSFVHEPASIIGDVIIGAGCYIGPFASIRADFGRVIIGDESNVQDNVVMHAFPGDDSVVEPHSHIGHGAVLHGCRIGSYALIGIGSTVLIGAEIGHDVLLGTGSLVTAGTKLPPAMLVVGNPCQVRRPLTEEKIL